MFAAIGIAAYAVAMVATMPASVFLKNKPWRSGIAGTIWQGEVGVTGGTKFEWRWAPLRSLTSLGFAADWSASGPDTDLGGRVLARPGRVVLDKVSGSANGGLLQVLQPDLPFTCQMTMQVEMDRIAVGGGARAVQGKLATDAGSCSPKGAGAGVATGVPALVLNADKVGTESRIRLAPATQRRRTLIEAELAEDGLLDLRMTPDGAKMLPFTGVPGGVGIQGKL